MTIFNDTAKIFFALAALTILTSSHDANADTFSASIGAETFTIVEADPFQSGGSAGNTVNFASPSSFWSTTVNNDFDQLYRERDLAVFGPFPEYVSLPGNSTPNTTYVLEFDDRTDAPELATTVSGLAANTYDVYAVYVSRPDEAPFATAGILADLDAPAATLRDHNNDDFTLINTIGWDISLSKLGTTDSSATSFTARIRGTDAYINNHYIGVAYNVPADSVNTLVWNTTSGDWGVDAHWNTGNDRIPNRASDIARFANSIGSDTHTVFTDSAITVNSIQFTNTMGGTYRITGGPGLHLTASTDGNATEPSLSVDAGGHEFQVAVSIHDNTTATIASGASLEFINRLNLNGNTLTKSGDGTLLINNSLARAVARSSITAAS